MAFNRRFASSLSAAFRPILKLLGMAQPTFPEFIAAGKVDLWYDYVLRLCLSEPAARARYEDSKSFVVRTIRRYKASGRLTQHEYIVAEVISSLKSYPTIYVQLERRRDPATADSPPSAPPDDQPISPPPTRSKFFTKPAAQPASPTRSPSPAQQPASTEDAPPTLSTSPRSSSTSSPTALPVASLSGSSFTQALAKPANSDSFLKDGNANDEVKLVTEWPAADGINTTLVEEITFKNTTLHDLVIVAFTLHKYSPKYQLFERQCYWFADLIIRVLEASDPGANRTRNDKKVTSAEAQEFQPDTAGQWRGLPIHKFREGMVSNLTTLYKETKEQFRKEVDNWIATEKKAGKADSESQRADNESQRADNEARKAQSEAQRADAEAQKARREAQRADAEAQKAKSEAQRADKAEEEIRQLKARLAGQAQGTATTA